MSTSTSTSTRTYADDAEENSLIAVEIGDESVAVAAFVDGDASMAATGEAVTALSRAFRRHHHGGEAGG